MAGVEWFGAKMEAELLKPESLAKAPDWGDTSAYNLMDRLTEEVWELVDEVSYAGRDGLFPEKVIKEAVDVANFAFFLAEKARRQLLAQAQREAGQLELPGIS